MEKIAKEIVEIVKSIPKHPENFGLDKYRIKNDGSFRYFEKYRLRFSFPVREDEIVILHCRHTSMLPKKY